MVIKEKNTKRITLVYMIYVIIIILITACLSIKIIHGDIKNISFIGKFIEPIKKTTISSGQNVDEKTLLDWLERINSLPKERLIFNNPIFFNSEGFKDYKYSIRKSNNTFRIIALGDSMTEGSWVSINDTWPKQLEMKLNKLNMPHKFEVLNFGIGGINTLLEVETFEKKGLKYNPDMVVLQFANNDWEDAMWIENRGIELWNDYKTGKLKLPEGVEKRAKEIEANDKLRSTLIYFLALEQYTHKAEQKGILNVWKENVETPLNHLIELCKSRNITLVVISWDTHWQWEYSQQELLKFFFDKSNIPYTDISNDLPYRNYQIRLPDDHLTEVGYDIVSDKIMKLISTYLN